VKIGDKVKLKHDIIETACGEHPNLLYAKSGEILVIRKFSELSKDLLYISHEDRLDNSFSVFLNEIEVVSIC
jgi:hypothetical protein